MDDRKQGPESLMEASIELEEVLKCLKNKEERKKVISEHIKKLDDERQLTPEFPEGLEWINSSSNLSFGVHLKGKVCILDFFTYCCINCLHILPDLCALEQQYTDTDGLVIIGVHSAKFDNEKTSANILSAVLRYNIMHPVVNDSQAYMWNQLGITCWPTLLVIGPNSQILLSLAGEGHRETLLDFTSVALEYYRSMGAIKNHSVGIAPLKTSLPSSPLLFPGKVCLDDSREKLIIADTGHHRILVVNMLGVVEECIGSGHQGFMDGSFEEATFNCPQGVCYKTGGVIYVADTENHSIREVDLNKKLVVTIVGTGKQGNDKEGGNIETDQEISSPWDVALCKGLGSNDLDVLIIAMAGTHQIWTLFLQDAKWIKNSDYPQGSCLRWAGSGLEQNRNNSYPHKAAFAQPSGLAVDHVKQMVYIADSESSSVRSISLKDGSVKGVVGGERDPMNLFAYGDKDGKGVDAKLQHPLGVGLLDPQTGHVVVADSFNHKIKVINPDTKLCTTMLGQGKPGNVCGKAAMTELNEPGGLCVDTERNMLYIADTNNHCIKVYNKEEDDVKELSLIFPTRKKDTTDLEPVNQVRSIAGRNPVIIREETLTVGVESTLSIILDLSVEQGIHLTPGAPSAWQLYMEGDDVKRYTKDVTSGRLQDMSSQPKVQITIPRVHANQEICLRAECLLYYCSQAGVCKVKTLVFVQNIFVEDCVSQAETCIILQHTLA